jgi:hypothetical protein
MLFLSKKRFDALSSKIAAISEKVGITESDVINYNYLKDEGSKRRVAYALNLCTVSVSQIVDYNDIYILEQEYDAILNNLNIQNFIKDESLLKVLKQILDTITFFRIQEGDKKFIEKEYQQKIKNAIWSAVPNLSIIFAGGNPITMAIAAATQVGIGYMNYRKNKNQYALEKEKQEWELQRTAIEQFNGLRRELFETAWRLSDRYNFDDKYRLTEKQISQYNTILLDEDPMRRFERLDVIQEDFKAFPPYWYYKGNAAREIVEHYKSDNPEISKKYKEKALADYEAFHNIYSEDMELMREDVIASSCFLEHIVLLNFEQDREKIANLLNRAVRLAGNNLDVLQQCVFHYISLTIKDNGYYEEVIGILRRLVNEDYNVGINGQMLSRIYFRIRNRIEYDILSDRIGVENVIPWIENEDQAHEELLDKCHDNIIERFADFLTAYYDKYEVSFNSLIPYEFSDTQIPNLFYRYEKHELRISNLYEIYSDRNKFSNFLANLSIVPHFIDLSNAMFDNLYHSDLFRLTDNDESPWDTFFKNMAQEMYHTIEEIDKRQNTLRNNGASDSVEEIIQLVKISEYKKYIGDFFSEIGIEFEKHLTVECLNEKQPEIDAALDKLYYTNGLIIPNEHSDGKYENDSGSNLFFKQIGFKEELREKSSGDFRIFEGKDNVKKREEIRICLDKRIKALTKQRDRILYTNQLKTADKIAVFNKQVEKMDKNDIPIIAKSIVVIVDTSIAKNLASGIWFCYDGIYLRKGRTDYLAYKNIQSQQIKKETDFWSPMTFVKDSGAKVEFKDTSINKDVLSEIIREIKDIIMEK